MGTICYGGGVATRLQTLVQLTDELVAELDRRAGQLGVSRSRLIRQLLERQLTEDRGTERTRALVDGYRRLPQTDARDEWGDLDRWTETNTRRNLAALAREEESSW
ncbi:hypothetical protein BH20ACT7_BH20ACT7_18960 [soil metagenome]